MPPRARLRSLIVLAAALATGALASGCGSSGASAVLDPVASAAETTNHADGARVAMQMQVSVSGVPQVMSMDAGGRLNFKSTEGEISLQLNGVPGAAAGGLGEGATIAERFVGGKIFVNTPAFAGKLPGAATWVELDLAATEKKLGIDPQSITSGESNPAQFLDYLRASGGSVLVTGTERVRGVDTTHYSGTVDLSKLASTGLGSSKAVDAVISAMGTSTIPVQVWVDAHKLVRRFTMAMPVAVQGRRLETKITVEFFDFGPQPAVAAPSASETYVLDPGNLPSSLGS